MEPVTYVLDGERLRTRVSRVLMVGLGGLALVASAFLLEGAAMRHLLQAGLLGAALLFGILLPAFFRDQDVLDRLRLDGEGITLARRGRTGRWLWSELSAVRLRSRFHPAALAFGRCITFRIPVDGRSLPFQRLAGLFFGAGVAVIGNDYFTESKAIAARLDQYRAMAAEGVRRRRSSGAVVTGATPAMFRARPSGPWWRRAARTATWILGALAVGFGIALVLTIKSLPKGWSPDDLLAQAGEILVIGAFISLVVGIVFYRQAGGGENFLLASDDGLHLRRRGKRQHWPWHFVTAFEFQETEGGPGASVAFKAIGEGEEDSAGELNLEEGEDPFDWPEAVSVLIEDVYEVPIEKISTMLNDHRRRAIAALPAS